ncbi:MAG: DUF2079 domain-containing protein, partial [Deltaproteobacteria bacterium]|nr:DUF2079 domain-containing protein [Deltaproteobacteria bacterium]
MKAEPASSELAAATAGAAPASGVTASRRLAIGLALVAGAGFTTLAYLRFATFHNGNFDLGFYTRMAWGLAHGDAWDPIVGADVRGLHLSPVVGVIGWIARVTTLPLPPLLLAAQGLAVALATWPMARIGERHLGRWGALLGASVWLLHPNLGHVASYDFHPGTLAVLPLALACDAVDSRRLPTLAVGIAGVACCREDLVLPAALLATLLAVSLRRRGWPTRTWLSAAGLGAAAIGYLAYWALVLHPMYAPPVGSLELHFGRLGGSVSEVAITLLTRPHVVLADAVREGRAWQLPLLLLPLAFAPLLSPRWLVAAAPVLVLNMLSTWPNTQGLYTHYATPILPMLATAAIVGAGKLRGRFGRAGVVASCAPALAAVIGHALVGGTPASVFWDRAA